MSSFRTLIEYDFKTGDNLSGFHGRFKILTMMLPPCECPEIFKMTVENSRANSRATKLHFSRLCRISSVILT